MTLASTQFAVISPERLVTYRAQLATMHARFCPRQVLGLRMGLLAGQLFGVELPCTDKHLFVFVETDGCLADAISVSTGCWLGHRTLRLIDHGKTAATFVDSETGRAFRIRPHPASRARAAELAPPTTDRWHAQRDGYLTMPATELLVADRVELNVDPRAIISRPSRRVECVSCGEEIVNEREVVVDGLSRCRACTGEAYFRSVRH